LEPLPGNDWVAAAAGEYHITAVKSDGSLWWWGWHYGIYKEDGPATYPYCVTSPKRVGTDNDWVGVVEGSWGSRYAIKRDGGFWWWGMPYYITDELHYAGTELNWRYAFGHGYGVIILTHDNRMVGF